MRAYEIWYTSSPTSTHPHNELVQSIIIAESEALAVESYTGFEVIDSGFKRPSIVTGENRIIWLSGGNHYIVNRLTQSQVDSILG